MRVVHADDESGWRLVVRDGTNGGDVLEARKTIPFDGVRKRTTADRPFSSFTKNSTFGLSASEVVDRYERYTGADIDTCRLCSWPVNSRGDREPFKAHRFCSIHCETKFEHLRADARDAREADYEEPRQ